MVVPSVIFIMMQGIVKVIVGREEMEFESGAFSYFGVPALQTALSLTHNNQVNNEG